MIATLRIEIEIKGLISNNIRELPVIIEEFRNKAKIDKYITEKKKKVDGEKIFSCDGILMLGERVVIPGALEKWY